MKFCDMQCKYAKQADANMDGAGACRTFIAIRCKIKNRIVFKNAPCPDKELRR